MAVTDFGDDNDEWWCSDGGKEVGGCSGGR